jgi:hypothetical protein
MIGYLQKGKIFGEIFTVIYCFQTTSHHITHFPDSELSHPVQLLTEGSQPNSCNKHVAAVATGAFHPLSAPGIASEVFL